MATLTETAYYTRRTINWLILMVICYFILRLFWSVFVALWLYFFPPKPPPPNHRFGKLPAVVFPPQASASGKLTFRLETIEGTVPRASESATVYFMPKQPANLLALPKTQEFAQKLEFDPTPIAESKNIYRFDDPEFVLRKLKYDIVSSHFILRYGFEQDTGLFSDHVFAGIDKLKADAIGELQGFNLWQGDIKAGTQKITFLKLVGDQLMTTTSLSVADGVRIDFFRKDIFGVKVFPPNPDEGSVTFIYSGALAPKKQLIEFVYSLWPIDYSTTATYALKPSALAWQELQSGGGYVARYPKVGASAVVRNIYLGYYDSYDPQTYLQPIFVFEGDNGFMAYVPAVVREWTE
ncbi:hypothetical protein HY086_01460 [Candidatus Gottesmanbacteria bacterium]|nr:hypothetical protein [Candidatus Gottesmanbacteria bacterium]